jgi:hypothetical protein
MAPAGNGQGPRISRSFGETAVIKVGTAAADTADDLKLAGVTTFWAVPHPL